MTKPLYTCDGCGRESRDIKSMGKDANGEPDAPDLCFLCRVEERKGKFWVEEAGRWIHWREFYGEEN